MPFELGIDVGCRLFGRGRHNQKKCLILEAQRFRYQAALSDLSNSDIAVHGGSPEVIVAEVRNWLGSQSHSQVPGPARVWGAFLDFMADNYAALKQHGFSDRDIEKLPIGELIQCIEPWVESARRKDVPRRGQP
jgi:hypothetical protein